MLQHTTRGAGALTLAFSFLSLQTQPSNAQETPVHELPQVDVTAQATASSGQTPPPKSALPDNIPATIETVTAQQIQEQVNAVTAVETLKYLPSIDLRERFTGDQNPMVGFRTVPQDNPAQSLIYADGILLSNLLGNYYMFPPVFQMITPNDISRADVMYGPFSALYPGNSYGGVVTLTTRMPDKFEFHADMKGFGQQFSLYDTQGFYPGYNVNLAVGDRINDFSYWLSFNHLTSNSQPLQFNPTSPTYGTSFGYPVKGGIPIIDYQGNPQIISGAFAAYTVQQETYRAKLAYDFTPTVRLSYTAALWQFEQFSSVQSYIYGANGTPVFTGPPSTFGVVNQGGASYYPYGLDPNRQNELQLSQGLELKSDTHGVFDFDAVVSTNTMLNNQTQQANAYGVNNSGQNTNLNGTNWIASDLRFISRPGIDLLGHHEISYGAHFDQYVLDESATSLTNWATFGGTAPLYGSYGETQTKALYIQDVWSFLPGWKLTLGGRQEFWNAFNGSFSAAGLGSTNYPDLSAQKFSPKASLSWQAMPALLVRASFGNANRFPTVTELYQSIQSSGNINIPNPYLQPEQVNSYDLTGEYTFGNNIARLTYFHEDRWNEIISQTNENVTPNVTTYQNVGKTQFNGIESALNSKDVLFQGFDTTASLTWTASEILANAAAPADVGKNYPGIARWRAKLIGTYHPTDQFSVTASVRYSSNPYATLDNSDWNHDVFGARSGYLLFDAKLNYKLDKQWTLSAGIDNIGSYHYYDYHPFQQRTYFAGMRYDY